MKWLIASDLHGSTDACRDLLAAFDREGAERLLFLGDVLYHGPRNDLPRGYAPKEVVALLNPRKADILAVRGNCESEVDQMVLEFPVMAEYAVFCIGNRTVYATHGHRFNAADPPPLQPGDVLLCGHTHVSACQPFGNGNLYCNPGSVAIPKEGTPAGYILLDGSTMVWKTLSGEPYRTVTL